MGVEKKIKRILLALYLTIPDVCLPLLGWKKPQKNPLTEEGTQMGDWPCRLASDLASGSRFQREDHFRRRQEVFAAVERPVLAVVKIQRSLRSFVKSRMERNGPTAINIIYHSYI